MSNWIWVFIGMGAVTYLPRMLPLVWLKTSGFPPYVQGVLKNVPFAILGALIFPGVIRMNSEHPSFGIVGAAAAFLAAMFKWNVMYVVVSSILALYVYTLFVH